jgi:hypothetical protein
MSDLVAWLRAQIDEDERVALAANTEEIHWLAEYGASTTSDDSEAHIKRHDPARVLAEVAAKRALLEECADTFELNSGEAVNSESVWLAEAIVKAMAQPLAGRPGWREEWTT